MYFKSKSIWGVVLLGQLVLNSGCGMIKNLTEMHDATGQMAKGMDQTITGMGKTNGMMGNMCAGQGKLNTSDYRDKLLNQIDAEEDIGRKLSLAVKYHYAWEFQGMSVECGRTDTYSQKVFNESIREFLESMHRFIASRSKSGATSRNNSMNTLYAIAATMHYTNSLQEEDAAKNGYRAVSMLDLLSDVANATAEINANKLSSNNLPAYVDSGRILLGDAIYMLRLRYNFLTGFAFGLATTNIVGDEATLLGLTKYVLDGKFNRAWRPDFENKNTSQINYYTLIMKRAIGARDILETMGESPVTDPTMFSIFRTLNFDSFDTKPNKEDSLEVSEKKQAVIELQKMVKIYLSAQDMI